LPWSAHQSGLARWAARRWGWAPGDPDWPSALALLACAEDEGHTAFDWRRAPDLWDRRFALEEPSPEFTLPGPQLWPAPLFEDGWLVRREGGLVQSARHADLERRLFGVLSALARAGADDPGFGQDAAVARAARVRLLLLAGGPGTGKTTTLKRLSAEWSSRVPGLRVVIAAPTGRAAARARDAFAGLPGTPECLTLHRLLGLKPGLGQPWHGPHRPLPFDLVIVDEASMLDLRTAVALTEALAPGAALVLVGDPGQLPSVDAGSVLADLLARPEFAGSTVRLSERFRLAERSRTLARVFDLLQSPQADAAATVAELKDLGNGRAADFRWLVTGADADPAPQALEAWGSPRGLTTLDLTDRILLSPVHRGPGGVLALGARLDRDLGRAPGTVAEGLPWMIRRNLPHLDLSNGDRGLLLRRDGRLLFETPDGKKTWPFSLVAEDGEAAWAVTVHKSQGSEYNTVVLVLPPADSPGVVRELVYTGLTRARDRAVLVASEAAVIRALSRGTDRQSAFGL
jgi:exodeoxyribonuclease V alpha subunit